MLEVSTDAQPGGIALGERARAVFGDQHVGVDLQHPDGRIVLGGMSGSDFILARYRGDGSLDTSFGKRGKVQTDLGGEDRLYALMVQPDGKIVVGGQTNVSGFWWGTLARYTASGQLDGTFGNGGFVQQPSIEGMRSGL